MESWLDKSQDIIYNRYIECKNTGYYNKSRGQHEQKNERTS